MAWARTVATVRVVDALTNEVILDLDNVKDGDLVRLCRTQQPAIVDWIRLAAARARSEDKRTGSAANTPVFFWLDKNRPHDAEILKQLSPALDKAAKRNSRMKQQVEILSPADAMRKTLDRIKNGKNVIAATGNLVRDYITDLFPALEVGGGGSRALSTTPLLGGGCVFEAGGSGTAPRQMQQLLTDSHLRWDSTAEALALCDALSFLEQKTKLPQLAKSAELMGTTLEIAISRLLDMGEKGAVSRSSDGLDSRGQHFLLAKEWARALSETDGAGDKFTAHFAAVLKRMETEEAYIMDELLVKNQGHAADMGGYYVPDPEKIEKVMRPSAKWNAIVKEIAKIGIADQGVPRGAPSSGWT